MELSPGQQRGLFVVVVVALAGLGIYLIGPGRHHAAATPAASSTPAGQPGPSGSAGTGAGTPTPALAGVPSQVIAPTPLPVPTTVKNANIYAWLPFTQQDLDAAASTAVSFLAADETYSYADTVTSYGQRLTPLATPTLLANLEQTFQLGLPAWKQQRASFKSGGTISQITAFGAQPEPSITFLVSLTEQTTANGKTTSTTSAYNVTAIAAAGGWQVNDIEQGGAGNVGVGDK
ncbi:MAG TPA: hypothetical protein VH478_16510 [Trebonia sp.]|jgi:hypothetical protein|nr:hypothetical protein [Trebonia sp.]